MVSSSTRVAAHWELLPDCLRSSNRRIPTGLFGVLGVWHSVLLGSSDVPNQMLWNNLQPLPQIYPTLLVCALAFT